MLHKRITLLAIAILIGGIAFLSNQTRTSASVESTVPANVTFSKEIAPIFFAKCAECHKPGEAAPFSALTFKDVRPWAKSIREKVANREMPPWHANPTYGTFVNDRRLSQKEIDTITAWVDQGRPSSCAVCTWRTIARASASSSSWPRTSGTGPSGRWATSREVPSTAAATARTWGVER